MKKYNKLVRDKIPSIIRKNGKIPVTRTLDNKAVIKALRNKLDEEIKEFDEKNDLAELADVLEVIYNISKKYGFSEAYLNKIRIDKIEERGSFDRNIFLEEVKEKE